MNAEAEDAPPPAPEPKNPSAEEAAERPASSDTADQKPSTAKASQGGVVEWLWGSRAMKAARQVSPGPNGTGLSYQREANLCLELGRAALEPLQPLEFGPAHGAACELYRQAIYWALLAKSAPAEPTKEKKTFAELWDSHDRASLLKAAGNDASSLDNLGVALKGKDFVDFAELSPTTARELSATLRHLAEALVEALDPAQMEVERIWMRRMTRIGALLAVAVVALIASVFVAEARERSRDVALGKPWETSTRWGEGCNSPEQTCNNSPQFFFHTLEENDPWVMIDLQEPTRISGVRVENRGDCCQERAIPLVVDVSNDKQKWTEVARRTTDFGTWKASFPATEARYVKLHVPRVTNLHFKRVRVLR